MLLGPKWIAGIMSETSGRSDQQYPDDPTFRSEQGALPDANEPPVESVAGRLEPVDSVPMERGHSTRPTTSARTSGPRPTSDHRLRFGWPTLGGRQWWTDHRWWHGFRMQQHQGFGRWRVLSDLDRRLAGGTARECLPFWGRLVDEVVAAPPTEVVILIHGLMRSSRSLAPMHRYLSSRGWGSVIDFRYSTTRCSIAEHARALRSMIHHLPGRPTLHFVCHSMGNIVLRYALGDWQQQINGQEFLDRLGRVVMLAGPNQGATIAKRLSYTKLFGWVTGESGMQLGPRWSEIEGHLATPPCPFLTIAGRVPWAEWNPLVPGPSDLIVGLDEARLEGATRHLEVPRIHSLIMNAPEVLEATHEFLGGR